MTLRRYQTLSGEVLDLDLSPAEDAFLADLRSRVADPTTSLDDIVDRAYSDQNPMLASAPVPGRGWVTPEIRARPAYTALLDILQRKPLARTEDGRDGTEALDVPGAEAAPRPASSTVLDREAAFSAGRPEGDAGAASTRGPEAPGPSPRPTGKPLRIVHRGVKGYGLVFRTDGEVVTGKKPATVTGWSEVWVKTVDKGVRPYGKIQVVRLVPAEADAQHGVGPLVVTGPFRLDQSVWGRAALDLWKSLKR